MMLNDWNKWFKLVDFNENNHDGDPYDTITALQSTSINDWISWPYQVRYCRQYCSGHLEVERLCLPPKRSLKYGENDESWTKRYFSTVVFAIALTSNSGTVHYNVVERSLIDTMNINNNTCTLFIVENDGSEVGDGHGGLLCTILEWFIAHFCTSWKPALEFQCWNRNHSYVIAFLVRPQRLRAHL